MERKRYVYLDLIKSMAIIFVCAYHFSWDLECTYIPGELTPTVMIHRFLMGIQSTCIPLFFMANGALLLNKELDIKNHLKKMGIILFQFWIWRAITFLCLGSYYNIPLRDLGILKLFNAIFCFGQIDGIFVAHFWFIQVLLGVYIIFPLLHAGFQVHFHDKNQKNLSAVLFLLFLLCFVVGDIVKFIGNFSPANRIDFSGINKLNPFQGLMGQMVFYFLLGGILHKKREKLIQVRYTGILVALFAGLALLFGEWLVYSFRISDNWDSVFEGYSTVATVLMSIAVYLLALKLTRNMEGDTYPSKVINIVGRNTLGVYYIHWILGYIIVADLKKYIIYGGFFWNCVKAISIALVVSAFCNVVKRIPVIGKLL